MLHTAGNLQHIYHRHSARLLLHLYPTSMWGRCGTIVASMQLGRTPDSSFSLGSSFTQSAHLFFGLPLLLPCTSIPIALFPTYSSILITCPYHRILRSRTFFEISSPTFVFPLIFSFLILSNLVTPHIHRNVFISATSIFSCAFFTAHVSATKHKKYST